MSDQIIEEKTTNTVAIVLRVIAWITYIGGFIAGIILAQVEIPSEYSFLDPTTAFSWTIALTYWAGSLISGTIFLGFAEIIDLLQGALNLNISAKKSVDKVINKLEQNNDLTQKLVNLGISNPVKTLGGEINSSNEQYQDLPKL